MITTIEEAQAALAEGRWHAHRGDRGRERVMCDKPSLAEVVARSRNASNTDPEWRADYTTPPTVATEGDGGSDV